MNVLILGISLSADRQEKKQRKERFLHCAIYPNAGFKKAC